MSAGDDQILADLAMALERILPFDKPAPAKDWTRDQALLVLRSVSDAVGHLMDRQSVGVVLVHPATQLLKELIAIIDDLKNGNVDPRLAPTEGLGGAALKVLERQKVALYLTSIEILVRARGMTYHAAQKTLEQYLVRTGERIRGKPVTATHLANWRRYPPGIKRKLALNPRHKR
jgi:hypothetical protein